MTNPFRSDHIAAGYAASRPAVHPLVVDRLRRWLARRVHLAVDVGCGAGLSTTPLASLARHVGGFDPEETMVRAARRVMPTGAFVTAAGEAMPFAAGRVELLTAAGSLNYTRDLEAVFAEAARVLVPDGTLAVYDFSPGRSFTEGDTLDAWFTGFTARYPYPRRQAIPLSPAILAERASGFRVTRSEDFALPLALAPEFYLSYILTETNVQEAARGGVPLDDIRQWCATTLADVFGGRPRAVMFRGYLATLSPVQR